MEKKFFLLGIGILMIVGCQTGDYEKVNAEKQALQAQLDEEKYGAARLLSDAKAFLKAGDLEHSEEKLNLLFNKHADKVEAIEAKETFKQIQVLREKKTEENKWSIALNSDDPLETASYITDYPHGKFIVEAKKRHKQLLVEKEKSDYQYAISENTSSAWKAFLEKYPNRSDIAAIKKKIIQAEVDEILGNNETGDFLPFNKQVMVIVRNLQ